METPKASSVASQCQQELRSDYPREANWKPGSVLSPLLKNTADGARIVDQNNDIVVIVDRKHHFELDACQTIIATKR